MAGEPTLIQVAANIGATGTASGASSVASADLNLAQTGDLLVWCSAGRATTTAPPASGTGGQTWTEVFNGTANPRTFSMFWAVFDGTWDSNPTNANSPGTTTIQISVWRAVNTGVTWSAELLTGPTGVGAPGSPFTCTIVGGTPSGSDPCVIVGYLQTADDNTWGSLSGSGWAMLGSSAGYANDAGSDNSLATCYLSQASPAAPGSPTINQATNGGDAYQRAMVAFKAAGGTAPSSEMVGTSNGVATASGVIRNGNLPAYQSVGPTTTLSNVSGVPWVGDPDNTDLYTNVNETTADDGDLVYVDLPDTNADSELALGLPTIQEPADALPPVTVRVRAVSADAGVPASPSGAINWTVALCEGDIATTRASRTRDGVETTLPVLTSSWQDVAIELTEGEIGTITDFTDLLVVISANTAGTGNGIAVSWVRVEVGTPPADGDIVGSAAGVGAASGVGRALSRAVASAAGVATAVAVSAAVGLAAGSSAGSSTASAVGRIEARATGTASGSATASATAATDARGAGSSAGVATASAGGRTLARIAGASAGAATAASVSRADIRGAGTASGVASADATARALSRSAGTAQGAATVSGVLRDGGDGNVGTATGTSAAAAVGRTLARTAGASSGTATASATGQAAFRTTATSTGTATASAVGRIDARATGSAAGSSTASGDLASLATGEVVGSSAGVATASGVARAEARTGAASAGAATAAGAIRDGSVEPAQPMRATLTRAPWIEVRLTDAPAIGAVLTRAPLLDAYRGDP